MSSTTTATMSTDSPAMKRRMKRSQSTPTGTPASTAICYPMSPSLDALDLSSTSPTETLASIRLHVLSVLADLEKSIAELDAEVTLDEWANDALEMLGRIRSDVSKHLPELPNINLADMSLDDLSSKLPDMPTLPDFTLNDLRVKLDNVYTKFHDMDINYLPTLSSHLEKLQSHLSDIELPSNPFIRARTLLSDLLDSLLNSEFVSEILESADRDNKEGEDILETAAAQAAHIAHAVKRSLEGVHLINISDLPHAWRNNPFVRQGYRFIPLERWPLILLSIFAIHNETLNIHTHLVPFILWGINSIRFFFTSSFADNSESGVPEMLFTVFALLCLFTSAVWHVMAGCADHTSMEFCARLDYVGIGWLISASVGTVAYYGFHDCQPILSQLCLALCLATGIAGSICPFMKWFNEYEYRIHRITFFLGLAFSAVLPMVILGYIHGAKDMVSFISPLVPSLLSYIIGLVFYATHFPERALSEKWAARLDLIGGGGSHCIWHCFIVLAICQHKAAMAKMKGGFGQCV